MMTASECGGRWWGEAAATPQQLGPQNYGSSTPGGVPVPADLLHAPKGTAVLEPRRHDRDGDLRPGWVGGDAMLYLFIFQVSQFTLFWYFVWGWAYDVCRSCFPVSELLDSDGSSKTNKTCPGPSESRFPLDLAVDAYTP